MREARRLTEDDDDDKPRAPRKSESLQPGENQQRQREDDHDEEMNEQVGSSTEAVDTRKPKASEPKFSSSTSGGLRSIDGSVSAHSNSTPPSLSPAAVARAHTKAGYVPSPTSNTVAGAVSVAGIAATTRSSLDDDHDNLMHEIEGEETNIEQRVGRLDSKPMIVAELADPSRDVSQLVEKQLQDLEQDMRRDIEEAVRREQRASTVEAIEVVKPKDMEQPSTGASNSSSTARCSKIWVVCVLLVLGAIGVVVGVVLSGQENDANGSENESVTLGTPAPTDSPSMAPTTSLRLQSLVHILEKYTGFPQDISLLDPMSSPQLEALLWLVDEDLYIGDPKLAPTGEILERYALAVLYFSTKGPEWRSEVNFMNSTSSVCDWMESSESSSSSDKGVLECENGSVTWIDLYENRLEGTIPTELVLLSNLRSLWMEQNRLLGSLPSELGALEQLDKFIAYDNQLTGPLPTEFGSLSSLTDIQVDSNLFTGPLPSELGLLSNLEYLFLLFNELTGPLPTELGQATSLLVLDIEGNNFSGPIPSELGMLTNLIALYLESNALTGVLPSELGLLTQLEELFFNSNELTGTVPNEFISLAISKTLVAISMFENSLIGSLDHLFCNIAAPMSEQMTVEADCGGKVPEIICTCCTTCHEDGENEGDIR